MTFKNHGPFSHASNVQEAMGIVFEGREPSEVRDQAAINWLNGHPDYEAVADEPEMADEQPIKKAKKAK